MKIRLLFRSKIAATMALMITLLSFLYLLISASNRPSYTHKLLVRPLYSVNRNDVIIGCKIYVFFITPDQGSIFMGSGSTDRTGTVSLIFKLKDFLKRYIKYFKEKNHITNIRVYVLAVYNNRIGFTSYNLLKINNAGEISLVNEKSLKIILRKTPFKFITKSSEIPIKQSYHSEWTKICLSFVKSISKKAKVSIYISKNSVLENEILSMFLGWNTYTVGYIENDIFLKNDLNLTREDKILSLEVKAKITWEEWKYPVGFYEHRIFISEIDPSTFDLSSSEITNEMFNENWRQTKITNSYLIESNNTIGVMVPKTFIDKIVSKTFSPIPIPENQLGINISIKKGVRVKILLPDDINERYMIRVKTLYFKS